MFENMSIRAKLFFVVGLMTILVLGAGIWGLQIALRANDLMSVVYEDQIRPIRDLNDILGHLVIVATDSVQRVESGQTRLRDGATEVRAASSALRASWVAFQGRKSLEQSEQERAMVVELENQMDVALQALDGLLEIMDRGSREPVVEYAQSTFYPAVEPFRDLITGILDQRLQGVETAYGNARPEFMASLRNATTVGMIGIIAAVVLCLVITRGINRSLATVNSKLEELAEGEADLTRRIDVPGSDEIAELARNFNQLMSNLEELVRQVKRSGIQVTSSTNDIAAGTKQLEATVSEQAASTNEVVASAKEISATAQELLNTMTEVAGLSDVTSAAASRGRDDLGQLEATMTKIDEAARMVGDRLAAISEKAGNISAVVDTINKVADQTNLLSLNAAIEAEKAGEYGRGFAVVAREIRRLADQTAVATLDIEKMVAEMKDAVTTGVGSMDRFAAQIRNAVGTVDTVAGELGEIIGKIQTLNPQFEAVFEGMQAQTQGAQQISDSMLVLGEASHQTAENLREANEAIVRLNDAARGLQTQFSRFTVS